MTFRWSSTKLSVLLSLITVAVFLDPSEALGQAAQGSVDASIQALGSLDPAQRIAAARALAEARDPRAIAPLARVLRGDPSPEVRGWAVRALGNFETAEARAALSQAAQGDADERVRTLATQILGTVASAPWQAPTVASGPIYQPIVRPMRARRPGLGLIVSGWTVLGTTYLISLLAAAGTMAEGADDTWPLFLPVAGPIIQAAMLFAADDEFDFRPNGALGVLALFDGLAQIAGLTLLVLGHVRRARANREQAEPATARARLFAILPGGPGDLPGLTAVAAF